MLFRRGISFHLSSRQQIPSNPWKFPLVWNSPVLQAMQMGRLRWLPDDSRQSATRSKQNSQPSFGIVRARDAFLETGVLPDLPKFVCSEELRTEDMFHPSSASLRDSVYRKIYLR